MVQTGGHTVDPTQEVHPVHGHGQDLEVGQDLVHVHQGDVWDTSGGAGFYLPIFYYFVCSRMNIDDGSI